MGGSFLVAIPRGAVIRVGGVGVFIIPVARIAFLGPPTLSALNLPIKILRAYHVMNPCGSHVAALTFRPEVNRIQRDIAVFVGAVGRGEFSVAKIPKRKSVFKISHLRSPRCRTSFHQTICRTANIQVKCLPFGIDKRQTFVPCEGMEHTDILAEATLYCERTGISPSTLALRALGNGRFFDRLGRKVEKAGNDAETLRRYMADNPEKTKARE